jgi:DNA-binding NtrC family response regulator
MLEPVKVMVYTTDSVLRSTRSEILTQHGYATVLPCNLREAIDLIRYETLGVLLLDHTLPSTHLKMLVEEARKRFICSVLVDPTGNASRISSQPLVSIISPSSPVEMVECVEEAIRPRWKRIGVS